MTAAIIQLVIILSILILQPFAHAQDMFVHVPVMGSLPPVAPVTLKIAVTDNEFSAIAWRGMVMHYPRPSNSEGTKVVTRNIDRAALNSFCTKPVRDENEVVREAWKEAFGFDVWYPYYRAKEVERWVKKKASVRVFRMKGEPIIEKGRLMYAFTSKF
ncbi:MAG: hypothetical protein PHS64_02920 [Candidatus Omnitrophica bacterium]|nr:hypothetical protein [Candidatus Omnitrophota bacterium]MDD5774876.1 hypothetical protein [Candidatus Omnitrophota bacterium]